MEILDSDRRSCVDERFALAVEELAWGSAELWFNDVNADRVEDLRGRSQLERALVNCLMVGPAALVQQVCRRFRPGLFLHVGLLREAIFVQVHRVNLAWMRDDIAHEDLLGAAEHFSRACHVPAVSAEQEDALAGAFDELVEAGMRQEAKMAKSVLADDLNLQRPVKAAALSRAAFGSQDPAVWMRIALSGLSSSSHHCHGMGKAVETMLHFLSWPTLRGQWWLAELHPEAIPGDSKGLPYVARHWLLVIASEPPGEPPGSFAEEEGAA